MKASSLQTIGPSRSGLLALGTALAAAFGATVGYAAHHGPVPEHTTLAALTTVMGAALIALAAWIVGVPRRAELLVVRSERPSVRAMRAGDVAFAATLYRAELTHGFFAQLGNRFAREYISSFAASPYAVARVAIVGEVPMGFLVGAVRHRAHRAWVLKNRGARLLVLGGLALVLRPVRLWRFALTRSRRYLTLLTARRAAARRPRHGVAPDVATSDEVAVLDHIAVHPAARGLDVGSALLDEFTEAASIDGRRVAYLCTLDGDGGAGGFYARHGWTPGGRSARPGAPVMREWIRRLDGEG